MMEDPILFVVGLVVTLAVIGALAFIIWAAVQDGHREAASAVERTPHGPPTAIASDPIPLSSSAP